MDCYDYESLNNLEFDENDNYDESDAESFGLDQLLNEFCAKENLNYFCPLNQSVLDEPEILNGYFKHLLGYRSTNKEFTDPIRDRNKPTIIVTNTQTVHASSSTEVTANGGSHWIALVILPRNYQPKDSTFSKVDNQNHQIFYLDSCSDDNNFPSKLKSQLQQKVLTSQLDENTRHLHTIDNIYHDAELYKPKIKQQRHGRDCGWWLVYNVMMLIYTGNTDFLKKFDKFTFGVSAKPLRDMWPVLLEVSASHRKAEQATAKRLSSASEKSSFRDSRLQIVVEKFKPQSSAKLPPLNGLKKSLHGVFYQINLIALIAMRAYKKNKTFVLISEAESFGNFDDLIIEDKNQFVYVQVKHTTKPEKCYAWIDLLKGKKNNNDESKKNGDFTLVKYFDSWYKLKEKYKKKSYFIFFSNIKVSPEIEELLEVYNFNGDDEFVLTDTQTSAKRINANVESKKIETLIQDIKTHSTVIKKIISDNSQDKNHKHVININHWNDIIKNFFNDFIIMVNQPDSKQIHALLKNEIKETFAFALNEQRIQFINHISNWLADHTTYVLEHNDLDEFIQKEKVEFVKFYLLGKTKKFISKFNLEKHEIISELDLSILVNFFTSEDKSASICVLADDDAEGCKMIIGSVVKKLKMAEDSWCYLKSTSWHFDKLDCYLGSKTLEIYVIDLFKAPDLNEKIEAIKNKDLVGKNKKILLLVPKSALSNSIANFENNKIIRLELPQFSDAQVEKLLKDSRGKALMLRDRKFSILMLCNQKNSHLWQMLKSPGWLLNAKDNLVETDKEEHKTRGTAEAKDFYLDERMLVCDPIYYLFDVIEVTGLGILILQTKNVKNSYDKIKEKLKDKFRENVGFDLNLAENCQYFLVKANRYNYLENVKKILTNCQLIIVLTANAQPFKNEKYLFEIIDEDSETIKPLQNVIFDHDAINLPLPVDYVNNNSTNKTILKDRLIRKTRREIGLVVADAGSGKTATLKEIASMHNNISCADYYNWVFYINLPTHDFKDGTFDSFIKELASDQPEWFLPLLLKEIEDYQVKFLFDAWDEVKGEKKQFINLFLKNLPEKISFDITSRPYAKTDLSLARQADNYIALVPFDEKEIKQYISQFFSINLSNKIVDANFIGQLADILLIKLTHGISENLKAEIGIPLQTKLLCEGLLLDIKKNMSEEENNLEIIKKAVSKCVPKNILGLYQQFILAKLSLFFEKHKGISLKLSKTDIYTFASVYLEILMVKAYQQLFDKDLEFFENSISGLFYSESTFDDLKDTGLVTEIAGPNFYFIHKTYEEYLCAIFILKSLISKANNSSVDIESELIKTRYNQGFRKIYMFLAKLSFVGDPFLPAWKDYSKEISTQFWSIVFQGPEDILGSAKDALLESCLSGFDDAEFNDLVLMLPEQQVTQLNIVRESMQSEVKQETLRDSSLRQSGSNKTPAKMFEFNLNKQTVPIESPVDQTGRTTSNVFNEEIVERDLCEKKYVKYTVSDLLNNKNSEDRNVIQEKLAKIFIKIINSNELSFFWDVDGGFEAMAMLGNFFSFNHAFYFIKCVANRTSISEHALSRAQKALTVICQLIKEIFEDAAFDAALLVIGCLLDFKSDSLLELNKKANFAEFDYFIRILLQYVPVDTLLEKCINLLHRENMKNYLFGSIQGKEINAFLSLFEIVNLSEIDKTIQDINNYVSRVAQIILLIAHYKKCPVICNHVGQLEVFYNNTQFMLIKNKTTIDVMRTCINEHKKYKKENVNRFYSGNFINAEEFFLLLSKSKQEEIFLNTIINVKEKNLDRLSSIAKKMCFDEIVGLIKKLVNFEDFDCTHLTVILKAKCKKEMENKNSWWSYNFGIQTVGVLGKYFDNEFAKFLMKRAKSWSNNRKEVIAVALPTLYTELSAGDPKGKEQAINAYNACLDKLKKQSWNHNLKPINISYKTNSNLETKVKCSMKRTLSWPLFFNDISSESKRRRFTYKQPNNDNYLGGDNTLSSPK
ncbi:MAG: hypothetical protein Tsb005_20870 [Gammaproteobacteria bacterium]